MSIASATHFDVVVAGAGPAGSTAAALIAENGHSVLLVERDAMPRLHVGESLIPAANEVLQRLGMIDTMLASRFPRKHSVQFVSASGHESAPFYFDDFESTGLGHTWQVIRSEFDEMLVENAKRLGANVLCRTRLRVMSTAPEYSAFELIAEDGNTSMVTCDVFVDATGQSALIGSTLGIKEVDPVLKNATVWTHYRGAQRDSGRDAGATVILHSKDKESWFWYIPLPDDVVSVGCTGALEYMFDAGLRPQDILDRELLRCPSMQCRLHNADRVAPVRATKDFSYKCQRGAGEGWVMVGDAYGFIDPVYSSGAFLALKSGEMAADSIVKAFSDNNFSKGALGAWQPEYDQGVSHFRKLVYAFYDDDFNFNSFLARFPRHRDSLTNVLVGNVFAPELATMFADLARGS